MAKPTSRLSGPEVSSQVNCEVEPVAFVPDDELELEREEAELSVVDEDTLEVLNIAEELEVLVDVEVEEPEVS